MQSLQKTLLMISIISLLNSCAMWDQLQDATLNLGNTLFGEENTAEPPAILTEYKAEIAPEIIWKTQIGVGKNKQAIKLNLAVNEGHVYSADQQGLLQSRHANTGELIWELDCQHYLSAGPSVDANTIIVGGSDAQVLAIDKNNGTILWTHKVSSEVLAVPLIAEGVIIIRTTDGSVFGLDQSDGHQLWSVEETPPALMLRGLATPILLQNKLLIGFASGKLIAIDLHSGKNLWETVVAMPTGRSEVERLVDLAADPVSQESLIYVSSYQGGLSAVAADGNIVWRNEKLSSASGLNSDGRYVYLTDNNSDVWQVDPRSGGTLWKQAELHYRLLTAPVVAGEWLLVGDYQGYLHWLSRNDGRLLARLSITESAIDNKVVVVDDIIYVYAKDGTLAAIKAKVL